MVVAVCSAGNDHANVDAPMSATMVAVLNMLVAVTSDTGFRLGSAVTLLHDENMLVATVATGIDINVMLGAVTYVELANMDVTVVAKVKGPG